MCDLEGLDSVVKRKPEAGMSAGDIGAKRNRDRPVCDQRVEVGPSIGDKGDGEGTIA